MCFSSDRTKTSALGLRTVQPYVSATFLSERERVRKKYV